MSPNIEFIRGTLSPDFFVYKELNQLCGLDPKITSMLSSFFWWADVVEKNEPQRDGWFWKTASDLKNEIGLSRRGYEKARAFLVNLGVVEYKRASIPAKMHWKINTSKLMQLVCKLKGKPVPVFEDSVQMDRDGFNMPDWIPIDLWHMFLDMRLKNGKRNSKISKRQHVVKLSTIKESKQDIRKRMEATIAAEWATFYPDNNFVPNTATTPVSREELLKQAAADRLETERLKEQQKQAKNSYSKSIRDDLLAAINIKKN